MINRESNFMLGCINAIIITVVIAAIVLLILHLAGKL